MITSKSLESAEMIDMLVHDGSLQRVAVNAGERFLNGFEKAYTRMIL
jgi:hypothetical protein